jgi:cholest-4-en-3-one 26-monooxygenase
MATGRDHHVTVTPTTAPTAAAAVPEGFDPTDPDVMSERVPHEELLTLRKTAPVSWIEQEEAARAGFLDTGFWAISKHADVGAVSKDQKNFSTKENGVIVRFAPDMTRDQVEQSNFLLINHDAPEHTQLRSIVSRAFTPRSIGALHDPLKERAEKIVADAVASGSGDFVSEVAAELPLQAIADLLGVPQEDRRKLFDWSNQLLSYDDPEIEGDQMIAFAEILGYSMAMAEERRTTPREDIVTRLVSADVDGRGLTDDEFGFFMILLAVAGNETTRNAITWGMHAFLQNPDQWDHFVEHRPDSSVDEIIRWATPVTIFQRTALNDVEVGGTPVAKGDRVGLLYASANFDDDVFEDPFRFDITRNPNPHVAFGGHGAHYCIGANLARLEVKLIFNALADAGVQVSQLAEPRKLRSAWINGVKELQVSYR